MGARRYSAPLFKSTTILSDCQLNEKKRAEREQYLEEVIREMRERLNEVGIEAEISGRPKHIYSIYRKWFCKINNLTKFMICLLCALSLKALKTVMRFLASFIHVGSRCQVALKIILPCRSRICINRFIRRLSAQR